jgi:hypothetical protein
VVNRYLMVRPPRAAAREGRRPARTALERLGKCVALSVLLVLVACGRTFYTPDLAGVVAALEPQADGSEVLRLGDGRVVTVPAARPRIVFGSLTPNKGELLLMGAQPEPWLARVAPQGGPSPDCFWIGGAGDEDGDHVRLDVGLRLAKAVDFDRGRWLAEQHRFEANGFCLNDEGEVTQVL